MGDNQAARNNEEAIAYPLLISRQSARKRGECKYLGDGGAENACEVPPREADAELRVFGALVLGNRHHVAVQRGHDVLEGHELHDCRVGRDVLEESTFECKG